MSQKLRFIIFLPIIFIVINLLNSKVYAFPPGSELYQATPKELEEFNRENKTNMVTESNKLTITKDQFKNTIQTFKNKNKSNNLDAVNQELIYINQKVSKSMLNNMNEMDQILKELESQIAKGPPQGKDLSGAKTALSDAKITLEVTRSELQAQTLKDYTIQINSEDHAKDDAQNSRNKLNSGLKRERNLVIQAKTALDKAVTIKNELIGR